MAQDDIGSHADNAWLDEEEEDEDGISASRSPDSVDRAYLGETAADEADRNESGPSQAFQRWKIDHEPGDFKYSREASADPGRDR